MEELLVFGLLKIKTKMEKFKIEFFKEEYGFDFPLFTHLSEDNALKLRGELFARFGITNILTLVEDISNKQMFLSEIDANSDFKLINTLKCLKIKYLDSLYLNWYKFDNIDAIALKDLDKYFYDIWYPGSDDIDIFDSNLTWIVSIRHDGYISFLIKD